MFNFIDLTEATTGFKACIRPLEIKALYETSLGTQVHYNGTCVMVKQTIDEIKALCEAK